MMKVENLRNANGTGYIHQHTSVQRERISQDHIDSRKTEIGGYKEKLRVPSNYQAKRMNLSTTITKEEQAFFENMYPSHKQKIKAYLSQQQSAAPVKGQFVDIRR